MALVAALGMAATVVPMVPACAAYGGGVMARQPQGVEMEPEMERYLKEMNARIDRELDEEWVRSRDECDTGECNGPCEHRA